MDGASRDMTGSVGASDADRRDRSAAPLSDREIAWIREALEAAGVEVPAYNPKNHKRHGPDTPVLSALAKWAGWRSSRVCGIAERRRRARAWVGAGSPEIIWEPGDRPHVLDVYDLEPGPDAEPLHTLAVYGGNVPDRKTALRAASRGVRRYDTERSDEALGDAIRGVTQLAAAHGRGVPLLPDHYPGDRDAWREAILDALEQSEAEPGGDALALDVCNRLVGTPKNRK